VNYQTWLDETPIEITNDPLWNTELYRLALFVGELAWYDAMKLSLKPPTETIASQLYEAAGSISAQIAHGFSRTSTLEQAQFYSHAIGATRATRDWYFKTKPVLGEAVMEHRIKLNSHILRLTFRLIPAYKNTVLYESDASYVADELADLLVNVPMFGE